jgi:hypothetical protein
VPCGKPACRKVPDLHGPYWYRYERDPESDRWRAKYLGTLDPFAPAPDDARLEALLKQAERLARTEEPTDGHRASAERLLRDLAPCSGELVAQARAKLEMLGVRYSRQLEARQKARYRELAARVQQREMLSAEERLEMERLLDLFSLDH